MLKKYSWLAIPIFFLFYSAPGALDYVFYFPDEKYYTDAALQMLDKNDWFTPYKADGTPRFLKPILTYWVLLTSYTIFGIGTFSSRLFFWLAGALLVYIVYRMSHSLLKNKKTAILAGMIAASNPLILMSASRSIPDILLVLFLTISAWGFLEIMRTETPRRRYYWMAYMGAALAFQTKGLPAVAFAGISILFLLFNRWNRKRLSQLIHPASLIAAVAVAVSWFVVMYLKHGNEYLESFFADQIGYRVSSRFIQVITNTVLGILNLLAFSLPWIVIVFSKPSNLKTFINNLPSERKSVFAFIVIWIIMVVAMSGAVFKFYDRYLLPVVPLISILFAVVITETATRFRHQVRNIFLVVNLVVLLMSLFFVVFISVKVMHLAGVLTGAGLFIYIFFAKKHQVVKGVAISKALLLLWFNLHVMLFSLLMPHPASQLADIIQIMQESADEPVYVYGNIRMASGIRVYSKNELDVISMDTIYVLPDHPHHLLVFNEKEQHLLDLHDYELMKGSEEWPTVHLEMFPIPLRAAIENIKSNGTVYKIAKPKIK